MIEGYGVEICTMTIMKTCVMIDMVTAITLIADDPLVRKKIVILEF